MATDRIADFTDFRGVLVPDPRITAVDTTHSTLTQAGPRPGVPDAQGQTEMVLASGGTQAASKTLQVQALSAGMPEVDGAAQVWRYSGDTYWRGWNPPTIITGWQPVLICDGSVTTKASAKYVHTLALASGKIAAVFQIRDNTIGAVQDEVWVYVRDPDTNTWDSGTQIYAQSPVYSAGRGAHPCLVELPNGRVLVFHWVELTSGDCQVRMQYTDDLSTWATGSSACLPTSVPYNAEGWFANDYDTMGRLRACYLNGEIALWASLRLANNNLAASGDLRDVVRQYGSTSLGARFTQVAEATSDGTYRGGYQDCAIVNGRILFAWCCLNLVAENFIQRVFLASAFEPFTGATFQGTPDRQFFAFNTTLAATQGKQMSDGDCAICVADSGEVYILHRITSDSIIKTQACLVERSKDGGSTWEYLGQTLSEDHSVWWQEGGAPGTVYPRGFSACCQSGRVVVVTHWTAAIGNEDDSVGTIYLGGYSTVTQPTYGGDFPSDANRASYEKTWLPFEKPDDGSWTAAGAGTGVLTGGELVITTSSNQLTYSKTFTSTVAQGLDVAGSVTVDSGGSVATRTVYVWVVVADGTNDYTVELRLGRWSVELYDLHGPTSIGTVSVDTSAGVDFKIALTSAGVAWWIKSRSLGSDAEWTPGTPSTSLTNNTGAAGPINQVVFGHHAVPLITAVSRWHFFGISNSKFTGATLAGGQTNPDDLFPRPLMASSVYVDGGTTIKALDGPAFTGDTWHIATRYDYAVGRVLHTQEPSPRRGWRSTDETVHRIAFALDPSITAASRQGNVVIAIAVLGANWRTGSLEADSGGGSWSSIGTVDAADGLASMAYVRAGNSLEADAGSTDTPYLDLNECRDWTVSLGSSKFRRVAWNSEGMWDQSGKRARLFLDGVDNTEPSSGTLSLWPRDFVLLVRVNSANYAGLRLVIDAQTTVDGYLEAGTVVAGPVVIWGQPYGWGRVMEDSANVQRTVSEDGTDRMRKLGPETRQVQIDWMDGVDETQISGTPDPDYVSTSTTGGSLGAADLRSAARQLAGMVSLTDGGKVPVVYLPKISKGSSGNDTEMFNRRASLLYGRMASSVRREMVQGDEGRNEVVRVSRITIDELK